MENETVDKVARETIKLFNRYNDYSDRQTWIGQVEEDNDFRYGNQWTEEQVAEMNAKAQPVVSINRIHPAIEMEKAMLTSQRPAFRVSPREDSDNQVAQALNGLLQYVWQISDADMKHADIVDDMVSKGVGYWYVYIDPNADLGRGEVKIDRLNVNDVYVDPNSRDRFFRDASNIIISRKYTKEQLKLIYPEFEKAIVNATGIEREDFSMANTSNQNQLFSFNNIDDPESEYVRYYERYKKEYVKRIAVFEQFSGREEVFADEDFANYVNEPVWLINGKVYTNEQQARQMAEQLVNSYNMALQNVEMAKQAVEQGQMAEEQFAQLASSLPEPPSVQQLTKLNLVQAGLIKKVEITTQRVKMMCVVGATTLYERILNTEDYPIIPYCNIHTGSPFPMSDVRIVKDKQKALNKINSIIIAHASLSTNSKLIVNRGSGDVKDIEKRWTIPGSIHEFDLTEGLAPIPVLPLPIPNQLFALDNTFKQDIDHEFGIYESMMGNGQQAPATYRATIAIDEFGQRKLRNKMQILETGLTLLGKRVLDYCRELYTDEKVIRLLNPNNSMSEYVINRKIYDEYSYDVLNVVNDISRAKYDVIVVAGSTLPSNRYAQLEFYMEAYKAGLIDNVEVLKKTEVFDIEGVLQRTDLVNKLQAELQSAQEQIKQLSGDLQTAQRETMHANMRTINAQYESKFKGAEIEQRKQTELFKARSSDEINNIKTRAGLAIEKEILNMKSQRDNKKK